MVDANHLIPHKVEQVREHVSNHRGQNMVHAHVLGRIGSAVLHNHRTVVMLALFHSKSTFKLLKGLRQILVTKSQVYKPGRRKLQRFHTVVFWKVLNDFIGHGSRIFIESLTEFKRRTASVITMLLVLGFFHDRACKSLLVAQFRKSLQRRLGKKNFELLRHDFHARTISHL